MANNKPRANRYKPKPVSRPNQWVLWKPVFTRRISMVLMIGLMSLVAIYFHDALVQSPFFTIQTLDISGLNRVSREQILTRAGLDKTTNLFDIRPDLIEKKLATLDWVARARVERRLFTTLDIQVEEQAPLAIVTIENLADIIINTQGVPFKEYDPKTDDLTSLPVITGLDLSLSDNTYLFEGELFNSVMDLLKVKGLSQVRTIHGDDHIGVLIQAPDIYNKKPAALTDALEKDTDLIPVKLGFHQFGKKLARAREISRYMAIRFPDKTILAMDLYDIEKIFIKTEDALHNTLEKGA